MSSANEAVDRRQYLSFCVAGGDYGLGILKVKEILQYEDVTPVPSTPRSIRGVLNLRGAVVPVVDLAVKFGLAPSAVTRRTCVLVTETALDGAAAVVGLVADSVSEVIELTPGDIEEAPALGSGVRVEFLLGMGKVGKRFVLLLDIDRVLAADERARGADDEPGLEEASAVVAPPPPGAGAARDETAAA